MIRLRLFVDEHNRSFNDDIIQEARKRYRQLPSDVDQGSTLEIIECDMEGTRFYLEITPSRGTDCSKLNQIANQFLGLMDVDLFDPENGTFRHIWKGTVLDN